MVSDNQIEHEGMLLQIHLTEEADEAEWQHILKWEMETYLSLFQVFTQSVSDVMFTLLYFVLFLATK